jgi:hypothetical protein
MYLDRNQEVARNWTRLLCLIPLIAFLIALVWLVVYIPLTILFSKVPATWIMALLVTALCSPIILGMIPKVVRVIDGNKRLITHDPLNPKTLIIDPNKDSEYDTNQTDPNEYGSGIQILWPWEVDMELVALETDISETIDQVISSIKDDTPTMSIEFDVEPDPRRIAFYILNGADETERKTNIIKRVKATVQSEVEAFFGGYKKPGNKTANGITIDALFKNLKSIKTELDEIFQDQNSPLRDECHKMGVRLKKVRIGDINRSGDNAKSVRTGKAAQKYIATAKKMMKDKDLHGLSPETAIAASLSIGDEIDTRGFILGVSDKVVGKAGDVLTEIAKKVIGGK